jgi:hypothetical protein
VLANAYKQLTTTIKVVNSSTRKHEPSERSDKDLSEEKTMSEERPVHSPTPASKRRSVASTSTSLPLDPLSVSPTPSFRSTASTPPSGPRAQAPVNNDDIDYGYAYPPLLMMIEIFCMSNRLASDTITRVVVMLIDVFSSFLDR